MEPLAILAKKSNNLFQSDLWADLQAQEERQTWVVRSDNVEALVIKCRLIRNKFYFYSPRGPLVSAKVKTQDLRIFLKKIESLAWQEGAVFYRIEPYGLSQADLYKFGFRKTSYFSPLSRQHSPENTLILDIMPEESKILAGMKPKWRYNINLASRKGVTVREGKTQKDIAIFWALTKEVEGRSDYRGMPEDYYLALCRNLIPKKALKLFIAEFEGEPLGAILVAFRGTVATYLHGATSNNRRELMPMYQLQWQAIQEAKRQGCLLYDFWGIAPDGDPQHPWAGITRFKKGFGGTIINFNGTFDLSYDKNYYRLLALGNRMRKVFKK